MLIGYTFFSLRTLFQECLARKLELRWATVQLRQVGLAASLTCFQHHPTVTNYHHLVIFLGARVA
jgi:hypothetical protein